MNVQTRSKDRIKIIYEITTEERLEGRSRSVYNISRKANTEEETWEIRRRKRQGQEP